MPRTKSVQDVGLLTAALEGLEAQKQRIDDQIRRVQALLGGSRRAPRAASNLDAAAVKTTRKRQLSAAARRRIAAAQKRRWAEYRRKTAGAGRA
jgi:Skp family chaperone for outer membrane proteins